MDIQSDAMVKAIDRNGKNVDDPEQEKKFEEASKRVDDVADISDQEVEDKGNIYIIYTIAISNITS